MPGLRIPRSRAVFEALVPTILEQKMPAGAEAWRTYRNLVPAFGDADAVPLGDYHLPHIVAWVFGGEPRGTDERMVELLEPYAGHRGRVLRPLLAAGVSAPRFGPRMPLRSIARI